MKINYDLVTRLLPIIVAIAGTLVFYFCLDGPIEDPVHAGLYMIACFQLWIVFLLMRLNWHFEKEEELRSERNEQK